MSDTDIKEFVKQQRVNGLPDKVIALRLLQRKTISGRPVSKEKIGEALHNNPESVNDRSTFSHNVSNLLKKG